MLQTGHGDRGSLPYTVKAVSQSYRAAPVMPVVQGEVCYEGIGAFCREEIQRWMFLGVRVERRDRVSRTGPTVSGSSTHARNHTGRRRTG